MTYFSAYEMRLVTALSALSLARSGLIGPADIVQNSTSSRASLGSTCFTRACERIGAMWVQAGQVEPELGLALLRAEHDLPGKKRRASFINVYASYLGEMVTAGLAAGLGPADFGLETISVGAEVVTAGLKDRAREMFGAGVRFDESYALTETWPFGAGLCEAGHLHFNPGEGLLEVLDPDTGAPVGPGEVGVIVATPFAPYREASVVLRYDTQDLVRLPATPPDCTRRALPATSDILGKRKLSVRHGGAGTDGSSTGGWTTPRDVLEALEGIRELPLPASARPLRGACSADRAGGAAPGGSPRGRCVWVGGGTSGCGKPVGGPATTVVELPQNRVCPRRRSISAIPEIRPAPRDRPACGGHERTAVVAWTLKRSNNGFGQPTMSTRSMPTSNESRTGCCSSRSSARC